MPNSNPAIWFEIYVQDMDRAKAFYEAVFQCKLKRLSNPDLEIWGFPMHTSKVGAGGALARMEGVSPGGGGTLVYFACEDCAVEAERAKSFGGRIHKDKVSIGDYGFIALVVDTESNMIGLHSMR